MLEVPLIRASVLKENLHTEKQFSEKFLHEKLLFEGKLIRNGYQHLLGIKKTTEKGLGDQTSA